MMLIRSRASDHQAIRIMQMELQPVSQPITPAHRPETSLVDVNLHSRLTAAQLAMGTCLAGSLWAAALRMPALRRRLGGQSRRSRQQLLTLISLAGA